MNKPQTTKEILDLKLDLHAFGKWDEEKSFDEALWIPESLYSARMKYITRFISINRKDLKGEYAYLHLNKFIEDVMSGVLIFTSVHICRWHDEIILKECEGK